MRNKFTHQKRPRLCTICTCSILLLMLRRPEHLPPNPTLTTDNRRHVPHCVQCTSKPSSMTFGSGLAQKQRAEQAQATKKNIRTDSIPNNTLTCLGFHGLVVRAHGLALLRLRLSREGGVVYNHVVGTVDDANVSGDLDGKRETTHEKHAKTR